MSEEPASLARIRAGFRRRGLRVVTEGKRRDYLRLDYSERRYAVMKGSLHVIDSGLSLDGLEDVYRSLPRS